MLTHVNFRRVTNQQNLPNEASIVILSHRVKPPLSKTRLDYARNLKICDDSRDTNAFLENIHISAMIMLVLLTSALFA